MSLGCRRRATSRRMRTDGPPFLSSRASRPSVPNLLSTGQKRHKTERMDTDSGPKTNTSTAEIWGEQNSSQLRMMMRLKRPARLPKLRRTLLNGSPEPNRVVTWRCRKKAQLQNARVGRLWVEESRYPVRSLAWVADGGRLVPATAHCIPVPASRSPHPASRSPHPGPRTPLQTTRTRGQRSSARPRTSRTILGRRAG
jgi:hypothetical protein